MTQRIDELPVAQHQARRLQHLGRRREEAPVKNAEPCRALPQQQQEKWRKKPQHPLPPAGALEATLPVAPLRHRQRFACRGGGSRRDVGCF
jgi:hypothetical protein